MSIQTHMVITTFKPVAELVTVMIATRVARLACGIECPENRNGSTQIGNDPVISAEGRRIVGIGAGIADRKGIAAQRVPTSVQQMSQIATPRERMMQGDCVQSPPGPLGHLRAKARSQLIKRLV